MDLGSLLPEALAAASFDKPSNSKDAKEEKKFPVRNPLEWALAFATYAAVATQHNPSRGSPLCTYMTIIMRMARQGRAGTTIVLGGTGLDLCPVAALLEYAQLRGSNPGPLFQLLSGQPMH